MSANVLTNETDFVQNTATTSDGLQKSILYHLKYSLGLTLSDARPRDLYVCLALATRDRVVDRMQATEERFAEKKAKRVYYVSMEFLIGRSLENNLINLGILDESRTALNELGVDIDILLESEPDAGLGNGGLGRLAACFIDSIATLGYAGFGYGINYEYGLFRQEIKGNEQCEKPDNWLTYGTPWQLERPNESVIVPIYGKVDYVADRLGEYHPIWTDWQAIIGVPHDMPVVGYGAETVNYLRLYSARGSQDFDMEVFNEGDYINAVEQKVRAETISKVLYPSDAVAQGKELRLLQEYFLVACSTRDLIRRFEQDHDDYELLPQHVAIQLNDTHPALMVAELMRLLVDEKNMAWDTAWRVTRETLAYTNHTLLPEALEKWPVSLVERVLPRHLQIILEINRCFMEQVEIKWPGDDDRKRRMSIIEEADEQQIRMCNLAIVGSHSVNGVSALHSDLVTKTLVPDFFELWPDHFNNKTNGITQRRWLLQSNPQLSDLITESIGDSWITNLDDLRKLEGFASDSGFQQKFMNVKSHNKELLAKIIREQTNLTVDPASMFDVQVKRIHEYKRQLLNVLRIIHDFHAVTEDGWVPECPRTYIFGGKAAPGYWAAKQFIKLICSISRTIEKNPKAREHMKVVMLPNYRVSLAERIFPASDLSEQVSTAGYEASGTGNMKFALNGALTMGTLDGANVEIREEVGDDNIFIFGLTADQIHEIQASGGYDPRDYFNRDERIRRVLDSLRTGVFAQRQGDSFAWIADYLLEHSEKYFHLADFGLYLSAQAHASQLYTDKQEWAQKAILNVARVGKFSSDRTIREYASEIWHCDR